MKKAPTGLKIHILGDSNPFSKSGKSIGYLIWNGVNDHNGTKDRPRYFIDCGAPLFALVEEIRPEDRLIITHAHEDHKRWLTDLAFYQRYVAPQRGRTTLATTETIHQNCYHASKLILERGLSPDSKRLIDTPYESYINPVIIGPKNKYRITTIRHGRDSFTWRVVDSLDRVVKPSQAKIFITQRRFGRTLITVTPRMLYKDDTTDEWVDPDTYYAFSENNFYEDKPNRIIDKKNDLVIRPIKSISWHGPPTIGLEIKTSNSKIIFSSDTVYNPELWQRLAEEYRPCQGRHNQKAFKEAPIIYDDINHYIQRTWSPQRYAEAISTYLGAVVIHDATTRMAHVHTTYEQISQCRTPEALILTHCPDRFISELPLTISGKTFNITHNTVREIVDGKPYPLNADIYYKNYPDNFVGYQSPKGKFFIVNQQGDLDIKKKVSPRDEVVMRVNLYQDIQGKYLPYLNEKQVSYRVRPDKQVERINYQKRQSRGTVVKNLRPQLL